MCLGGCGKAPVLCLAQLTEGFERSKLNLDRLNLTQTHTFAHALTDTVIRLSTNIIWGEWVFSEMHLFPSHYWREEGGGWRDGGGGGGLLICPMQCRHLTNFMQPFNWLPPLAHLCFLPPPHWARSQRNRSMQMSYRHLKGPLALNQVYLGDMSASYDSLS